MELSTDISGASAERLLHDDTFQEGGHRSNKLSRNKDRCNGTPFCNLIKIMQTTKHVGRTRHNDTLVARIYRLCE